MKKNMDMRDIGKYLPELTSKQTTAAEKAAEYLGSRPVYPTWTGFDPKLLGTPVMGYEAEKSALESAIGPNVIIAYNPDLVNYPKQRKKAATHEGVHLAQRGKKELLKLNAMTPFGPFYIGLALIEGGNEVVTEKIGEEKSGAYHNEYRFAKSFNDNVMDLGSIYKMAEYRGADAVKAFLSQPQIKEKVYRAFLEAYVNYAQN